MSISGRLIPVNQRQAHSARRRTWLDEKITQLGMWLGLDGKVYRRFHDLAILCQGGTTQIDHILVSVYGVFVIETKNMNGWILGDE